MHVSGSSALDPSTTWEYWKLLEDTQVSGLVTPTTYYAPDLTSWYTGAWNFERPFINGMYAFKKDHSGYNGVTQHVYLVWYTNIFLTLLQQGKLYNLADSKTFRSFSLFVWFYSLAGVGGYQHLASFPLNGNLSFILFHSSISAKRSRHFSVNDHYGSRVSNLVE